MKWILRYNSFLENKSDFNFKELFLELTEYTIPLGYEHKLEPILYRYVPDLKKDSIGNYYYSIGNSDILFTSHLDTFSKRYERVNHLIEGDIIKTDGSTILGGDNKNGVIILLYMITNGVPGNYYFFIGEEGGVSSEVSCYGSSRALEEYGDKFKNMKAAVAFDRRGEGSVVIKQRGVRCCSDEFAESLISHFENEGLKFKKDKAYGTDSAVFMGVIPEVTNISSSGKYEHTNMESTDIGYLKKVAKAAINITWDELPIVRGPKIGKTSTDCVVANNVIKLLSYKGFNCIDIDGDILEFSPYIKDGYLKFEISDNHIILLENKSDILLNFQEGDLESLKLNLNFKTEEAVLGVISGILKMSDRNYNIEVTELDEILNSNMITFADFKKYIISSDYNEYFKFYNNNNIYMSPVAGQVKSMKRQKEQEMK